MKKSKEYNEPKESEYVKLVVEQLNQVKRIKTEASTIQSASTEAIINRAPEKDQERIKQLTDRNFWLDLEKKSKAEHPRNVMREIDPKLYSHIEAIRRRPKNSIGQSDLSSASEQKKEMAKQAFTCTPAAPLNQQEKQKVKELIKIKELQTIPPEYVWKEMSFFQAMWHRLKGGEIKKG